MYNTVVLQIINPLEADYLTKNVILLLQGEVMYNAGMLRVLYAEALETCYP